MKKIIILLLLGMMVIGSGFTQNSNITQKIVGTWTSQAGDTWIISADGKIKHGPIEYLYAVTDTILALCTNNADYRTRNVMLLTYSISISSDGKTLILTNGYRSSYTRGNEGNAVAEKWFTKQ